LADSHPDFHTVAIEEESHQIKVDQVRALNKFMVLTRQMANYRVAIICDAELLNPNAANSLLKTLEEPPAQSLIALVTTRPALLSATLRSRCQQLRFVVPTRAQGMTWLRGQVPKHNAELLLSLAHGAPLKARQMADSDSLDKRASMFNDFIMMLDGDLSVLELVQRCDKWDLAEIIEWIHSWLIDGVRSRFQADTTSLANPDLYQEIRGLCARVDLRCLFKLQDEVLDFKRNVGTSMNRQLMLEDMLLASIETFCPESRET
jgi:DNA polymerase-3 subunit delta'